MKVTGIVLLLSAVVLAGCDNREGSSAYSTDQLSITVRARVDSDRGITLVRSQLNNHIAATAAPISLDNSDSLDIVRGDEPTQLSLVDISDEAGVYGAQLPGIERTPLQLRLLRDAQQHQDATNTIVYLPQQPSLLVYEAGQHVNETEQVTFRYSAGFQKRPITSMAIESTVVACFGPGDKPLDYAPYEPGTKSRYTVPADGRATTAHAADLSPEHLVADHEALRCDMELRALAIVNSSAQDALLYDPRIHAEDAMLPIEGVSASAASTLSIFF